MQLLWLHITKATRKWSPSVRVTWGKVKILKMEMNDRPGMNKQEWVWRKVIHWCGWLTATPWNMLMSLVWMVVGGFGGSVGSGGTRPSRNRPNGSFKWTTKLTFNVWILVQIFDCGVMSYIRSKLWNLMSNNLINACTTQKWSIQELYQAFLRFNSDFTETLEPLTHQEFLALIFCFQCSLWLRFGHYLMFQLVSQIGFLILWVFWRDLVITNTYVLGSVHKLHRPFVSFLFCHLLNTPLPHTG